MALVVLPFATIYPLYFAAQRVMLVRNLLVVVPFLAILAARGAGVCRAAVAKRRWGPAAVTGVVGAKLAADAAWLVVAGRSIRATGDPTPELVEALSRSDAVPCVLSRGLRRALAGETSLLPAAIVPAGTASARWVAFRTSEVRNRRALVANRRGYAVRWFGPHEVSFDYYPDWVGRDRIVIMRVEDAAPLDVPVDE
jgi:hypothetical protein